MFDLVTAASNRETLDDFIEHEADLAREEYCCAVDEIDCYFPSFPIALPEMRDCDSETSLAEVSEGFLRFD